MYKKILRLFSVFILMWILTGCNMQTVDKLYCLPKRPQAFKALQTAIDQYMTGLEYSAPIAGEHQQSVQAADLTGDGSPEYLVFATGSGEKPLQILIFTQNENEFVLMDRLYCNGTAFDQVEYVRMDNRLGYELVVGRKLDNQVLRTVSVYFFQDDKADQKLTVSCSQFICNDIDDDGYWDLMILRPGELESGEGVAELYSAASGNIQRSAEANMTQSSDSIKRIIVGNLEDGPTAVYVACGSVNDKSIVTDVFAVVDGRFSNICKDNASDTVVETLRNYYIYADDIDEDGVLELPTLVPIHGEPGNTNLPDNQYIIKWCSISSIGIKTEKRNTYHNFVGGWYIHLDIPEIERIHIQQVGNSYEVSIWNKEFTELEKLLTIYALTGQNREEQAVSENRFVLRTGESTVYAAKLEAVSAAYGITRDKTIRGFHMILQDWKTGET